MRRLRTARAAWTDGCLAANAAVRSLGEKALHLARHRAYRCVRHIRALQRLHMVGADLVVAFGQLEEHLGASTATAAWVA